MADNGAGHKDGWTMDHTSAGQCNVHLLVKA